MPCKICNDKGFGVHKCIFCGAKEGKPKKPKKIPLYKMTDAERHAVHCEKVRLAYLQELWLKLRKFQQETTGVKAVDDEVREAFGDWKYSWF